MYKYLNEDLGRYQFYRLGITQWKHLFYDRAVIKLSYSAGCYFKTQFTSKDDTNEDDNNQKYILWYNLLNAAVKT